MTDTRSCGPIGLLRTALVIAYAVGAALTAVTALAAGGLLAGYRPVVITTASMAPAAAPGSLVIAAPTGPVEVGDILVMRRNGRATVTHRVVDLGETASGRYAITRGDANAQADAAPYQLSERELIGRWVLPGVGWVLIALGSPLARTATVALTVGLFLAIATGRFRAGGTVREDEPPAPDSTDPNPSADSIDTKPSSTTTRSTVGRSRRSITAALTVVMLVLATDVALSLYLSNEAVGGNTFSTRDCYDARLGSVQSGQLVSTANGAQTVGIAAVDPAASFLVFSVRSSANEPADAAVQGRVVDGTTLEFTRRTDAGSPPPVTIEWSVVDYACGVSVQRGVTTGSDTASVDVALTSVDTAASFVLLSSVSAPAAVDFDGDDLTIAELTSATNLRLRTMAPATLPATSSYAWQVVTFTDPTDVAVQTTSVNLGATTVASLPVTATDPSTTIVLATTATASTGPDVGERMIRAHLSSPTTVEVARLIGGDPIEVHLQIIELREGSTVQHGTLDLIAAQTTGTVSVAPVDPSNTTALGTVQVPGSAGGGASDHTADDVVGEASATVVLSDPTTVTVTRDASAGAASFGWQAVTWGGPTWWDPASPFRQRIDITAGAVASPDGYTTPLTLDHDALVSSGLSLSDGRDLRVLRWDGGSWNELDRVLDESSTWNATDTTLWFRTQEPIAATATVSYWLYFGNPSPPAAPEDPDNVWLLNEGFESGTLGSFEDRTTGTGWYRALPWSRRIPLSVDAGNVQTNLADAAVLVRVVNADLGTRAQADASDIRFAAADGVTTLPHSIESWDSASGTLTAWVRHPLLTSSVDTSMFLVYGAADAPAQADVRGTWGTDLAVWNLARDPGGIAPQLDDESSGNHDGLSSGGMAGGDLVSTGSGEAVDFDGIDDRLDSGPLAVPAGPATISAWFSGDTWTGDPVLVAQGDPATNGVFELAVDTTTTPGTPRPRARLRIGSSLLEATGGVVGTGGWHHVVATWDGSQLVLYLDGSIVDSSAGTGSIGGVAWPVAIGASPDGSRFFDGRLGQIRLLGSAWTAARVGFAEADLRSPDTAVAAGGVESGTWFDQGDWSIRRPMLVDSQLVAGSLVDYPLLIETTDPSLAAGAGSDGFDLVFTAADGVTRLDHEIEAWNPATGALTAWVRLPNLTDTTDTELFLYYGAPGADDQEDPGGVWGPEADLVAHLSD